MHTIQAAKFIHSANIIERCQMLRELEENKDQVSHDDAFETRAWLKAIVKDERCSDDARANAILLISHLPVIGEDMKLLTLEVFTEMKLNAVLTVVLMRRLLSLFPTEQLTMKYIGSLLTDNRENPFWGWEDEKTIGELARDAMLDLLTKAKK